MNNDKKNGNNPLDEFSWTNDGPFKVELVDINDEDRDSRREIDPTIGELEFYQKPHVISTESKEQVNSVIDPVSIEEQIEFEKVHRVKNPSRSQGRQYKFYLADDAPYEVEIIDVNDSDLGGSKMDRIGIRKSEIPRTHEYK